MALSVKEMMWISEYLGYSAAWDIVIYTSYLLLGGPGVA